MYPVTTPVYMHDNSFDIKTGNNIYNPISTKVLNKTRIPFFEFRDEEILNIYIGNNHYYNRLNNSNLKQLYKLAKVTNLDAANSSDWHTIAQSMPTEIQTLFLSPMKSPACKKCPALAKGLCKCAAKQLKD